MSLQHLDTVKARVYIEGVLFPYVKNIQVSDFPGQVRANIQIPPSPKLKPEELDGAALHIFYANDLVLQERGGSMYDPPLGNGWPILFQGEITGHSESATIGSESLSLRAVGHSRHFDQTQLYFYDPQNKQTNTLISAQQTATFLGNTVIRLDTQGVLSKKSRILQTMIDRIDAMSEGGPGRNVAFSSVLLEILKSAKDRHPLFDSFDRKFRLVNRFCAYADFDVENILKLTQLAQVIDQRAAKLPSYASLKQILDLGVDMMQYDWNHIAQPTLHQLDTQSAEEFDGNVVREMSRIIRQIANNFEPNSQYKFNGNTYFTAASSELPRVSIAELTNKAYQAYKKNGGNAVGAINAALLKNIPSMDKKDSRPDAEITDTTAEKKEEVSRALQIIQDTATYSDELHEFALTPNMRFSHPPRCNVLPPSMYTSYGINRNALQEITRLYGQAQIAPSASGTGEALTEWYIAPISQGYHLLTDGVVSDFSDEYNRFMRQNRVVEEEEDGS